MSRIRSRFADVADYYSSENVSRIVDPKQQDLYLKNGLYPVDMYYSGNKKVMVFNNKESYECYQKWLKRELN